MHGRERKKAPDYTDTTLVMGLMTLIYLFFVLWAVFGFWAVPAAGLALNLAIGRLAAQRARG
ncbi:MAG: hypothetical protein V2I65_14695 [Paracoccaceae bacterium]|jgi:hypothetical protein|nr:hypothetical protein [Paracoccaceae bacterium]